MASEGGSKAHSAVENIYGENCKVGKLDCVGHVQKRMGHLMKLKETNKSKLSNGKTIGEKGRLSTEGKIKQFQKYYRLGIRQNTKPS